MNGHAFWEGFNEWCILFLCGRNLHDSTLSVSVECTSVRLLLNLVEVVFARRADIRSAEAHRALLAGILDAFTSKLSSLHHRLPQLLSYGPPSSPVDCIVEDCTSKLRYCHDMPGDCTYSGRWEGHTR